LPVSVDSSGSLRKVKWSMEPELLDYATYLPIFFEGIREKDENLKFLAVKGTEALLLRGKTKINPVLP